MKVIRQGPKKLDPVRSVQDSAQAVVFCISVFGVLREERYQSPIACWVALKRC